MTTAILTTISQPIIPVFFARLNRGVPLHRKIGGMHFLRLFRLQVSFCIVRAR